MNAMGKQTMMDINTALEDIEGDPAIIVIIIRGAEGNFCTGMDRREQALPVGPEAEETTQLADRLFEGIRRSTKITIALVEGYCMAGGFEIVLNCDFIIAETDPGRPIHINPEHRGGSPRESNLINSQELFMGIQDPERFGHGPDGRKDSIKIECIQGESEPGIRIILIVLLRVTCKKKHSRNQYQQKDPASSHQVHFVL